MKTIIVFNVFIFIIIILGVSAEKSWVRMALETQRALSSSLPIDKAPLVGTHNSYSSSSYGSLFRNQNLSLSAQFDLGVRYIELDLHYIPELNETSKGPYRICHASSGVYLFCDNVAGWEACNETGVLDYGPDTGCTPATPNYTEIFSEINSWLTANSGNIIVINLDDSISGSDIEEAGDMQSQMNGWLEQYFGNSIYTPLDFKREGYWPTVESLTQRGKRIIFNTNNHTFNGTYIFPDLRGFVWPASKIKYFSGYPSCESLISTVGSSVSFGFFQEDRLILNFHGVLLYNGSEEVGIFDASSSLDVMQCQFSTCYDFISEESAQQLVWSWDFNQPNQSSKYNSCGSVNLQTGRWQAEDCSNKHYFACKSKTQDIWTLGDVSSTRLETYDLETVCPTGYTFSSPRTAQENSWMQLFINSQLGNNNNNDNNVWISMSRYNSGGWTDHPLNATNPNSSRAIMVQSNCVYLFAAILVMFVIY